MPRALLLFAVLFGSFAYFYEGGGWNQNTRFNLVRAIVERGTVRIDAYHENTGDKAQVEGHYYTDKAPGASLIAVPAVAVARGGMNVVGIDPNTKRAVVGLSYVATLAAASVPAAIASVCVFLIAIRLGTSDAAAAIAAIAAGLATPQWAYATLLYGHALAAGCLALAWYCAVLLGGALRPARQSAVGLLLGLSAGWAVVTEFPASIASGLVLLLAFRNTGFGDRRRLLRIGGAVALGLAVTALVLIAYNWIAFRAPLHIAYSSEDTYEGMKTGIFGVNLPSPTAAWEILFGAYRGLIPLAPALIVAPLGLWRLARMSEARSLTLTAAAIVVYYFLLTAGYVYWSGGWSYGSRHLGPALPFLSLGIAAVWQRSGRAVRVLVAALVALGAFESLVAVATTAQPPSDVMHPMRDLLWPIFRAGEFPIVWQSVLDLGPPPGAMSQLVAQGVPREAWNLGQLIGLQGHVSLLPLYAMWIAAAALWRRLPRVSER